MNTVENNSSTATGMVDRLARVLAAVSPDEQRRAAMVARVLTRRSFAEAQRIISRLDLAARETASKFRK